MDIGFLKSWEKGDKNNKLRKKTLKFFEILSQLYSFSDIKIGFKVAYRTVQGITEGII